MFTQKELEIMQLLKEKHDLTPDEFTDTLNGFLLKKGVNYWDYVKLNILLNIQQPLTHLDDEYIFIVYHQIAELYFSLILHELKILTDNGRKEFLSEENWIIRTGRIINYLHQLTESFQIMHPGEKGKPNQYLKKEEFSQFRLALMPASGFQTVSLRKIEFYSTSLYNLLHPEILNKFSPLDSTETLYEGLYWKYGGWIVRNGKRNRKTKTLEAFENEYDPELKLLAESLKFRNLHFIYFNYQPENEKEKKSLEVVRKNDLIKKLLHDFDEGINKKWKAFHLSVIRLHIENSVHGTGGTNWKEYLPPEKQMINYFPELIRT